MNKLERYSRSPDHSPERERGSPRDRVGDSKRRDSGRYHHHEGSKEKEARSKRKDREEESGARAGKKKSRFEDVARSKNGFIASETSSKIFEAVKRAQELAAQMGQSPTETAVAHKPTKTPVLRLDALGREIDEHGRVISVTKPCNLTTLKVNINQQKKDAFQILKPHQLEVNQEENPHFDPRMASIDKDKILRPKRMSFQFVEQGKWTRDAEKFRLKTQFGEAKARELKVKLAHLTKAKDDINPNLIELSQRVPKKEKPKELTVKYDF